jgi:16S rRNA (cytidine1402-2'-O)-methyltransferase
MAAARELTKVHEEFIRGRISEVLNTYKTTQPIGEFTLIIAGPEKEQARWPAEKLLRELRSRLEAGEAPSLLAQSLSIESGWSRREIYRLITTEETHLPS